MTTANALEVDKFNRLAATWWDESGPMWPLHRLNALRVPYILERVAERWPGCANGDLSGLSVLDIGCGAGILSESMAAQGARVHGIDPANRNIRIAARHAQVNDLSIRYETGAVESLTTGNRFDLVLNMEVVEHVDDLPAFMATCASHVAPGGMMVLATINRTLYSLVTAIFGAEYILGWLPRGTHEWSRFVTPRELSGLLADNGFETLVPGGSKAVVALARRA